MAERKTDFQKRLEMMRLMSRTVDALRKYSDLHILASMHSSDILASYIEPKPSKLATWYIRYLVLTAIEDRGGSITPKELGKEIHRSNRSVTALVDSLERLGLVYRKQNIKDRRSVEVIITEEGRSIAKELRSVINKMFKKILGNMDKKNEKAFGDYLTQLKSNLLNLIDEFETPDTNGSLDLPLLNCIKCGNSWFPQRLVEPKLCPKCKSPHWNKPKPVPKNKSQT